MLSLFDQVEELESGKGIWISSKDLKSLKRKAKSATGVARMLTRTIFSDEALLACSVLGNEATGKGKELVQVRPRLDETAVTTIVGKLF